MASCTKEFTISINEAVPSVGPDWSALPWSDLIKSTIGDGQAFSLPDTPSPSAYFYAYTQGTSWAGHGFNRGTVFAGNTAAANSVPYNGPGANAKVHLELFRTDRVSSRAFINIARFENGNFVSTLLSVQLGATSALASGIGIVAGSYDFPFAIPSGSYDIRVQYSQSSPYWIHDTINPVVFAFEMEFTISNL